MNPSDNSEKDIENKKALGPEARKAIRLQMAKEAQKEIKTRMVTVITTAFALVAALFWQTAITDTIKTFIPISGAWGYEIIVAAIITLGAAVIIYIISTDSTKGDEKARLEDTLGTVATPKVIR